MNDALEVAVSVTSPARKLVPPALTACASSIDPFCSVIVGASSVSEPELPVDAAVRWLAPVLGPSTARVESTTPAPIVIEPVARILRLPPWVKTLSVWFLSAGVVPMSRYSGSIRMVPAAPCAAVTRKLPPSIATRLRPLKSMKPPSPEISPPRASSLALPRSRASRSAHVRISPPRELLPRPRAESTASSEMSRRLPARMTTLPPARPLAPSEATVPVLVMPFEARISITPFSTRMVSAFRSPATFTTSLKSTFACSYTAPERIAPALMTLPAWMRTSVLALILPCTHTSPFALIGT